MWIRKRISSRYLTQKLTALNTTHYHVLEHINKQNTQIDYLIVSIYGIIVVKQINWTGEVMGTEEEENWVLKFNKQLKTIKNPLHEYKPYIQELAKHLKLPTKQFHQIVAVSNQATLSVDQSLIKNQQVCHFDQLVAAITQIKTPILSKENVQLFAEQLKQG